MKYIFRKKSTENFTTLTNKCIQDNSLSFEARGLLHYLLSKPDNWEVRKEDLIAQSPNGGDYVIRRILKELETAGYIYRKKMRNSDGTWAWVTLIFDRPLEEIMDEDQRKDIDAEMAAILGPEILERTRKIKEGAKQHDHQAVERAAAGIGEKDPLSDFPVDVKETLRAFMKVSQIAPTKAKKADWIKTAREWQEMGVKPEDVKKMYAHALNSGWDIARPGSITSAYYPSRIQVAQDTEDTRQFRMAQ